MKSKWEGAVNKICILGAWSLDYKKEKKSLINLEEIATG